MTRKGRRIAMIAAALGVVGAAAALALYALSDNIVFFYSPSELAAKDARMGARLRIGGPVASGSVLKSAGDKLALAIADGLKEVKISYEGLTPDLFREGRRGGRRRSRSARGISRADDPGEARRTLHAARGRGLVEKARTLERRGR